MIEKWETLNKIVAFHSKWFSVVKNSVKLPKQDIVLDDYYVVEANDSAMIVAIDSLNRIILKKEYRFPVNEILVELPAGGFEPNEKDPLMVAKRELLEETGYASNNWKLLAKTYDCPNRCNDTLYLFLAQDSVRVSNQQLDDSENIDILLVPFGDAVSMCKDGRIKVNSCVHAILKAAEILEHNMLKE